MVEILTSYHALYLRPRKDPCGNTIKLRIDVALPPVLQTDIEDI